MHTDMWGAVCDMEDNTVLAEEEDLLELFLFPSTKSKIQYAGGIPN